MQFSENWLRELVDIDLSRAELSHRLTMAGLEVEAVQPVGENFDGLVVAEIITADKHPQADRLQICTVDAGAETLTIVCGAPNARVGLKAPLATVGTTMPDGTKIKRAKLRGVESSGMLCSAAELGLDADASGLLELPHDAPVGEPLATYLGLPDASFDVGLTPNRSDCLGMHGIARDVAALLGSKLHVAEPAALTPAIDSHRAIRIEAGASCPRYTGRIIENIDPSIPTPSWMAHRLRLAGLRPKSIIVDVTNYVMLETGQPLHAFDNDKLDGAICVRQAHKGEVLQLLTDVEVTLDDHFLVIADDRGAQALGGIMGGKASSVSDSTTAIFLESAHFAPAAIMGRARTLGLHTDASHRFERGVDPQLPVRALERASQLLLDLAGGVAGPISRDETQQQPMRPTVKLRHQRLQRILGIDVAAERVTNILESLGMQVQVLTDGWEVHAPSWRFDIAIEEDLIEEVARIVGYDTIPVTSPSGKLQTLPVPENHQTSLAIARQLVARDYCETVNMAFLDEKTLTHWGLNEATIPLANPLTKELAIMRPSLLPGLVNALKYNLQRQQSRVRLFERGHVFAYTADHAVQEVERVAWVATGLALAEQWGESARALDFHDVRGDLDALLQRTGLAHTWQFVNTDLPAWLHPGRGARLLCNETPVGCIGMLHPSVQDKLHLKQDVYVVELDYAALARQHMPRAGVVGRFPLVRRDIAIELPQAVCWADVSRCIHDAIGKHLKNVLIFDKYTGEGVADGYKSLAIGLWLQDTSRTLTDADVNHWVETAVTALEQTCRAQLRG